jgi:hypothetical protein
MCLRLVVVFVVMRATWSAEFFALNEINGCLALAINDNNWCMNG